MRDRSITACAVVRVPGDSRLHLAGMSGPSDTETHTLCLRRWSRREHTAAFRAKDDCPECVAKQEQLACGPLPEPIAPRLEDGFFEGDE